VKYVEIKWFNLVQLYFLDAKDRLVHRSILRIVEKEQVSKSDEITFILLITVLILFFFATSLKVFIALLVFGLVIGIFWLIKHYKEKRLKMTKIKDFVNAIVFFLLKSLRGCKFKI